VTESDPHRTPKALWTSARFPLGLTLLLWIGWQALRVLLWVRFAPAGIRGSESLQVFASGFASDLVAAIGGVALIIGLCSLLSAVLALPSLLLMPLGIRAWVPTRRALFRIAITVALMVVIFLGISEWYFFAEFESRFNTVAIDYLIYPHEVFTNLRESYPLPWIGLGCLVGGVALSSLLFLRVPPQPWHSPGPTRRWGLVAGWTLVAGLGLLHDQTRSIPHPRHRVMAELSANGWTSALRAAWSRNLSYPDFYPVLERAEAFQRVRSLLAEPGAEFVGPSVGPAPTPAADGTVDAAAEARWLDTARDSLRRRIPGDPSKPRLNLCLITEESLGSEFWGCLGRQKDGRPDTLTPRMDRLVAEGATLFTHLLADGNRTIRGLEAIYSSFPPLPGDSILARDKTENVETLARVLKRDDYSTLFLYAGHGTFDYIRSYSQRNGWDRLVEESDFQAPVFRTAWGVSDEDLLQRGIEEMRALHRAGKPFLTTFMTVSNHRPFTHPPGRIPEDPGAPRRDQAVRYADWALGDFFERARQEAFWSNTVFVVIADHGARVYGSQTIPLRSYQIPCVVVAPALRDLPRRIDAEASQMDIVPTLLGMIGRPYESLFFGHNVLDPVGARQARCLMHHNRSVAVYRDHRQVVFGLNKTVEHWSGEPGSGAMTRGQEPDDQALSLRDDGIALFQVADELYTARHFNLPTVPATATEPVGGRPPVR
jgi:phosphoglycerol transferase MdoB-like AlkP superfamily enzyme